LHNASWEFKPGLLRKGPQIIIIESAPYADDFQSLSELSDRYPKIDKIDKGGYPSYMFSQAEALSLQIEG
ncbi:16728_t:CDS:2, partial [Entrophospora sp. SA101]